MSPAEPQGRRYFTPHFRLLAVVNEIGVSPGARVTLTRCLRRARKLGELDAGPGEGVFWTTRAELARETGLSEPTQWRRLKELRDRGLLRWRIVDQKKALPNGAPAEVSCLVVYLNVAILESRLALGGELAKGGGVDQFDRGGSINLIGPPPHANAPNPAILARPSALVSRVNQDLKITDLVHAREAIGADASQSSGGCGGSQATPKSETETETETETVFEVWWTRVGSPRQLIRGGHTADGVRAAIADCVERGYSARDLLDVLDAATDKRIGGAYQIRGETPWQWVQRTDTHDGSLFRGPMEKLLRSARECRAADAKRAIADARRAQDDAERSSSGGEDPKDAGGANAWQQRPSAEQLRAELAEALRSGAARRRA